MRVGLSKSDGFLRLFNELSAFRFGSRDPPGCVSQRPNRKPPQRRQSTPRQEKALLRRLTAARKLAAVPIGRLQLLRVALTAEFLDLRQGAATDASRSSSARLYSLLAAAIFDLAGPGNFAHPARPGSNREAAYRPSRRAFQAGIQRASVCRPKPPADPALRPVRRLFVWIKRPHFPPLPEGEYDEGDQENSRA
jgi:hypothetical protein